MHAPGAQDLAVARVDEKAAVIAACEFLVRTLSAVMSNTASSLDPTLYILLADVAILNTLATAMLLSLIRLAVASKVVESKAKNLEAQKAPYVSISQQMRGDGSLLLNPLAEALNAPVERPVGMPTMADIQAEIARRRKL